MIRGILLNELIKFWGITKIEGGDKTYWNGYAWVADYRKAKAYEMKAVVRNLAEKLKSKYAGEIEIIPITMY
jgi:hypothetical protein